MPSFKYREFYIPGGAGFLPSTVFVSKVASCLLVQQSHQKFRKLWIWPDISSFVIHLIFG